MPVPAVRTCSAHKGVEQKFERENEDRRDTMMGMPPVGRDAEAEAPVGEELRLMVRVRLRVRTRFGLRVVGP